MQSVNDSQQKGSHSVMQRYIKGVPRG